MELLKFQKIGHTLEHKWDTFKSMMQSIESCNSDNHNLLKQQYIIYNELVDQHLTQVPFPESVFKVLSAHCIPNGT